jgi:hypothetical protein
MTVTVKHQDGEIGVTETVTAVLVNVEFLIFANTTLIVDFEGLSFNREADNDYYKYYDLLFDNKFD